MTDKLRHGPLWTTIFAIISLIWIYPIALVFINSFKKRVYISKDVFSLPTGDTFVGLENYERGMEKTDILPSFGWTIILTLGSVALILLCCSMCAWWIVRVNNWVAKLIYLAFIASVVVPFQMVMFPPQQAHRHIGPQHAVGHVAGVSGIRRGIAGVHLHRRD